MEGPLAGEHRDCTCVDWLAPAKCSLCVVPRPRAHRPAGSVAPCHWVRRFTGPLAHWPAGALSFNCSLTASLCTLNKCSICFFLRCCEPIAASDAALLLRSLHQIFACAAALHHLHHPHLFLLPLPLPPPGTPSDPRCLLRPPSRHVHLISVFHLAARIYITTTSLHHHFHAVTPGLGLPRDRLGLQHSLNPRHVQSHSRRGRSSYGDEISSSSATQEYR